MTEQRGGFDNAVLPKTWRDATEASYLVSPRWRRTRLQKRRNLLRARVHDPGIRRSVLHLLSPAPAHARPQRKAAQVRRAEKSYRQPVASSSSENGEHSAQRRSLHRPDSDFVQSGRDRVSRAAGKSLR